MKKNGADKKQKNKVGRDVTTNGHSTDGVANHDANYVVQKYIERPFLVGGKKFDLRIFALVTSFSPLEVWLYRSGFCRFSSSRYKIDQGNLSNSTIHLTNVSIQKKNHRLKSMSMPPTSTMEQRQKHDQSTNFANNKTLWDLQDLKLYLLHRFQKDKVDSIFGEIQNIIFRTLHSVVKDMIQDVNSFELYGFDLILDERLKPWLLEVNASPSLTANNNYDEEMKKRMVVDVLDVVDMESKRSGNEIHVGGFDLIEENDDHLLEVDCKDIYGWRSYLGASLDL